MSITLPVGILNDEITKRLENMAITHTTGTFEIQFVDGRVVSVLMTEKYKV